MPLRPKCTKRQLGSFLGAWDCANCLYWRRTDRGWAWIQKVKDLSAVIDGNGRRLPDFQAR